MVNWQWGPREAKSIQVLKTAVIENTVFSGSELKQYYLSMDASKTGIGRVMLQLLNKELGTKIATGNRSYMWIVMFISLRFADADL